MSLLTIGVNHDTAPVEIREKVAFSPELLLEALTELGEQEQVNESVILSTCNRTELYIDVDDINKEALVKWLADFHSLPLAELNEMIYSHTEVAAVEHLMSVASGLNSLILGEPQILGQLKQAYTSAKHVGTVSGNFERLFQTVFAAAKRVRTETDIGENAVSVAFAAVQLAKHIFTDVSESKVLLIGAGETIELVAKHLADQGVGQMVVANRTLSRGQELAAQFNASTITLSQLHTRLSEADIVISSTASQLPLVGKGMVETALKQRRYKPMLLIDLAVPRDIEEECEELDGAYLYTVDDLQSIVAQNVASRQKAADEAKSMIAEEVGKWVSWQNRQQHSDLIKQLRANHEIEKQKLLQRAKNLLSEGAEPEAVMTELANKLTNALSHAPTHAIKKAAEEQDTTLLKKLSEAYKLETNK
ncbi:glutamyl-tRNA reductase [Planctobacterium marinum]|uniref:Glutamyl-tRNA reductase n=1 Tax=Planctobacterium marinum TaxID=1631968 RepID=A0AA48HPR7_9ALTE|nr:glutamyl-tRNA reductase [Planctobacterium marinum]